MQSPFSTTSLQWRVWTWLQKHTPFFHAAIKAPTPSPFAAASKPIDAPADLQLDVVDILRTPILQDGAAAFLDALPQKPMGPKPVHQHVQDSLRDFLRLSAYRYQQHAQGLLRAGSDGTTNSTHTNTPAAKRPVVFIPRHESHLVDLFPVAHALQQQQIPVLFLLYHDEHFQRCLQENISAVLLMNPVDKWQYFSLLQESIRICREYMHVFDATYRSTCSVSARDPNLYDALIIRKSILSTLQACIFPMLQTAWSIASMINHYHPQMIVVGNPYIFEGKTAISVAKQYQIPTLTVEHGSIFAHDLRWKNCSVDTICVWGTSSQTALIQSGVDPQKIICTGAPRLDALISKKRADLQAAQTNIPKYSKRVVLVATSGAGDSVNVMQHSVFIAWLTQATQALPEIEWRIKLHPKDRRAYYQSVENLPNVCFVQSSKNRFGLDIYEALAEADILLTVTSTSAVDAMLMGVPVISVQLPDLEPVIARVPYLQVGATYVVTDPHTLIDTTKMLLYTDAVQRKRAHPQHQAAAFYVSQHHSHQGDAAFHVAAAIVRGFSGAQTQTPTPHTPQEPQ